MKKLINVKSYLRQGKLVRHSQRNIDNKKSKKKNNNLLKITTITGAALLGTGVASYLILRKRYLNNLVKAADNLKANKEIGEVLDDKIKTITFTVGGFGGLDTPDSPFKQSRGIGIYLKKNINKDIIKTTKIVPIYHEFTFPLTYDMKIDGIRRMHYLSKEIIKGRNDDAIKLAEEIYSWHVKNPTKQINILSFSAGTNLSRDAQYILNKKGVKNVNLINLGGVDFKIVPQSSKTINIMGTGDSVKMWKAANTKMVDVDEHLPYKYLKNDEVKQEIIRHFYS